MLTVGATDEADRAAVFSSASPAMDLAAPGQDIEAAVPTLFDPSGYALARRHELLGAARLRRRRGGLDRCGRRSTNTQLFEVMRRSARDVGKRRLGPDTGYGILDVPAALDAQAAGRRPAGAERRRLPGASRTASRATGKTPLTCAAPAARHDQRRSSTRREDPEDVYRVYLPAKGKVVVTVRPNANVSLELWGTKTTTVFEQGAAAQARPARRLGPCGRDGSSASR